MHGRKRPKTNNWLHSQGERATSVCRSQSRTANLPNESSWHKQPIMWAFHGMVWCLHTEINRYGKTVVQVFSHVITWLLFLVINCYLRKVTKPCCFPLEGHFKGLPIQSTHIWPRPPQFPTTTIIFFASIPPLAHICTTFPWNAIYFICCGWVKPGLKSSILIHHD